MNLDKLKTKFKDSWIKESKFELNKIRKFVYREVETTILEFDKKYLEKQFDINKKFKQTYPGNWIFCVSMGYYYNI